MIGEKRTVVKTLDTKNTEAREIALCARVSSNTSGTPATMSVRIPTINPMSRMQPKHLHQR